MEKRKNRGRTKIEITKATAGRPVLCEYLRAFEKTTKKISDTKKKQ